MRRLESRASYFDTPDSLSWGNVQGRAAFFPSGGRNRGVRDARTRLLSFWRKKPGCSQCEDLTSFPLEEETGVFAVLWHGGSRPPGGGSARDRKPSLLRASRRPLRPGIRLFQPGEPKTSRFEASATRPRGAGPAGIVGLQFACLATPRKPQSCPEGALGRHSSRRFEGVSHAESRRLQ